MEHMKQKKTQMFDEIRHLIRPHGGFEHKSQNKTQAAIPLIFMLHQCNLTVRQWRYMQSNFWIIYHKTIDCDQEMSHRQPVCLSILISGRCFLFSAASVWENKTGQLQTNRFYISPKTNRLIELNKGYRQKAIQVYYTADTIATPRHLQKKTCSLHCLWCTAPCC